VKHCERAVDARSPISSGELGRPQKSFIAATLQQAFSKVTSPTENVVTEYNLTSFFRDSGAFGWMFLCGFLSFIFELLHSSRIKTSSTLWTDPPKGANGSAKVELSLPVVTGGGKSHQNKNLTAPRSKEREIW
jgi:hypothetical protein